MIQKTGPLKIDGQRIPLKTNSDYRRAAIRVQPKSKTVILSCIQTCTEDVAYI